MNKVERYRLTDDESAHYWYLRQGNDHGGKGADFADDERVLLQRLVTQLEGEDKGSSAVLVRLLTKSYSAGVVTGIHEEYKRTTRLIESLGDVLEDAKRLG